MMTRDNYLPQYTLDRLAGRVCNSLERFDRFLPETMWIRPIEYCLIVEQEPRNISTVIFQAMKNKQKVSEDIMDYNQFLTRMYMLLYYRHSQDKVYQTVVFPALITYMGIYAKEETLKGICKGINILQEEDRLVESALGKKPEDITPTTVPEIALVNDPYGPGIIVLDPQTGLPLTGNETIPEKPSPAAEEPDADAGETDGDDGEEKEPEDVLLHKVSFEFFLRLLEGRGLDFWKVNNKDIAGLWHMVTGLSSEEFRRFCSNRNQYSNRATRKDIVRLNKKLAQLHIDIEL
jgi:hypothetical protein